MLNTYTNYGYQGLGNNPYLQNNQMQGYGPFTDEIMHVQRANGGDAMSQSFQPQTNNSFTAAQVYPFQVQNENDFSDDSGIKSYARGGKIRKAPSKMPSLRSIKSAADYLKNKGQRGDTVLAHINPEEEEFLKENFGGDINPHTGLPQFGLFSKPSKWLSSSLPMIAGAVIGNMIAPGVGGVMGASIGGAAGSVVRGRSDYGQTARRGAGVGAALPSLASGAGAVANGVGANGVGSSLTDYGTNNSVLTSIGKMMGYSGEGAAAGNSGGFISNLFSSGNSTPASTAAAQGVPQVAGQAAEKSLMGQMMEPKNLLTIASLAGQYLGKEKPKKEKTGAELGKEAKEFELARMLSAQERKRKEDHDLEEERSKRRIKLNSYLPEERIGNVGMLKSRILKPEEAARMGRQYEYYYDDAIKLKEGGSTSAGTYFRGKSKGQADKIPAYVSDGEFVIPADVVSHLGDGNNEAGANELYKTMDGIRKDITGSTKLPKKSKSFSQYMRAA